MNQTREEALRDLGRYANSYLQGCETSTETAKAYAEKLSRIKHAYSGVVRTRGPASRQANVVGEKMTLAVVVAGLIAWFVIFNIMGENFNLRAVYVIILCLVLHFTTRNSMLSFVPFFVIFIGAFFELAGPLILAYLAVAAVYAVFHLLRKKKAASDAKAAYAVAKDTLLRLQKELKEMLPQVRKELQQYEGRWYTENQALLVPADRRNFLGEHFPPAFWWQLPIESLDRYSKIVSCDRYGDWETKLVYREPGTEFDGLEEYTPLCAEDTKPVAGKLSDYYTKTEGYQVYDIISRLTILTAQKQTVQYQVPAHGTAERLYAHMSVACLADDIDRAFADNRISSGEYRSLTGEVASLAWLASEYSSETKTETGYEYVPVHNHANIWTGQVALQPVEIGGTAGYVLGYYTCQLPHVLENLDALRGLNIISIDYDCWCNNPYFLARFFSIFPNAM